MQCASIVDRTRMGKARNNHRRPRKQPSSKLATNARADVRGRSDVFKSVQFGRPDDHDTPTTPTQQTTPTSTAGVDTLCKDNGVVSRRFAPYSVNPSSSSRHEARNHGTIRNGHNHQTDQRRSNYTDEVQHPNYLLRFGKTGNSVRGLYQEGLRRSFNLGKSIGKHTLSGLAAATNEEITVDFIGPSVQRTADSFASAESHLTVYTKATATTSDDDSNSTMSSESSSSSGQDPDRTTAVDDDTGSDYLDRSNDGVPMDVDEDGTVWHTIELEDGTHEQSFSGISNKNKKMSGFRRWGMSKLTSFRKG